MTLKDPKECQCIEEIRKEIDKIDNEIIALFAQRHKYVEEIVNYKNDEEGVVAEERKEFVIKQRGMWANENGLNQEVFEEIYSILIRNNIKKELEIFRLKKLNNNK